MKALAAVLRRLYRLLLRLHPRDVRRDYGGGMWETALRRAAELDPDRSVPAAVFWGRECGALVASILRAWQDRSHPAWDLSRLLFDLRTSLRSLTRRPGYLLVAVATLSLGIGANTALFSVVRGVLLDPLPGVDEGRLVHVWEDNRAQGGDRWELAPADFLDYRTRTRALDDLAGYAYPRRLTWTGDGDPRVVRGLPVTGNLFKLVGVGAHLGRTLLDADQAPEPAAVAVVSHAFWQAELGGDPEVVGRVLVVDDEPVEIVGVMPPAFRVQRWPVDLWYPEYFSPSDFPRSFHVWYGIGRLADGAGPGDALQDLLRIARGLGHEHPDTNEGHLVTVLPLRDALAGEVRPALLLLMGVVALVLLIACSNVANLALVRALRRQRETALRAALGAGRTRLVRAALLEGLMVAAAGGALGCLLAWGLLDSLLAWAPAELPGSEHIGVDGPVLAVTAGATTVVALFVSLSSVVLAAGTDPGRALHLAGGRATASRGQRRAQGGLILAQIALAAVLLVGAGLLLRSVHRLQAVDPGVAPGHVVTAEIDLPPARYPDGDQRLAFWDGLVERVRALPGVEAASLTSALPVEGGGYGSALTTEAPDQPPESARPTVRVRVVHPGFFRTLGVPLLEGRPLDRDGDRDGSPLAVVVNRTLAVRHLPSSGAVDSRIKLGPGADQQPWLRVVGVVEDIREQGLRGEVEPAAYLANSQGAARALKLVARTGPDATTVVAAMRSVLGELDPGIPLHRVRTLESVAASATRRERSTSVLLSLFAGLATVLAALGVYAVSAWSLAQRRPEIAVRVALGAGRGRIVSMAVGDALRVALGGAAVGLLLALAGGRFLGGLLYGVSATDPGTLVAAPAFLLLVVGAAAYLPARRAAATDPGRTLRAE